MSYFDHISCHSCGAMLKPEQLQGAMACPACNQPLSMSDLFGLKEAFLEDNDDHMGIDDLVPGGGPSPRPSPRQQPRPTPARPSSHASAANRRQAPSEPDSSGAGGSALDWIRAQRKKK